MQTSLYIHIPWCIRKCPYCDFNSHKAPETIAEEAYMAALVDDLQSDLSFLPAREIRSIFIGGGTPSLISAQAYGHLFEKIHKLLPFSRDIEISLEANPGTTEQQRFKDYRSTGINRLSLGIQSFNAEKLQLLGRIHDEKQAQAAIVQARKAGFQNINIDLMHGLPKQTLNQGLEDLNMALSFAPEHLSWYQLTLEPNTLFYKERPRLPKEGLLEALETQGLALLSEQGYERYEISAFCQKEQRAAHNMNYWLFGDYYGIGAGAHGKIRDHLEADKTIRTRKQRQPKDYLNPDKPYLAETNTLSQNDLIFEFMLNVSRLEGPIPRILFKERTGLEEGALSLKLKEAAQKGLIALGSENWQITALGRRFTNDLQALFL